MKKDPYVSISIWYESEAPYGIANYLDFRTSGYLREALQETETPDLYERNKRIFSGVNGITIIRCLDGVKRVMQFGGWDGNRGLYCYSITKDGKFIKEV